MLEGKWRQAINKALRDSLDVSGTMPESERDGYLDKFSDQWSSYSTEAFKRALQNGDVEERLFAIFALGYLDSSQIDMLLTPFLDSPIRKERWASAITLAAHENNEAFSRLPDFLMEELEYSPPSLTADTQPDKLSLEDTWQKVLEEEETAYIREYEWYLFHRLKLPLLLGSRNDFHVVSILAQTFQRSIELEFHSTPSNNFHIFTQEWHQFQDRLAYALGQLKAWHALDLLDLPPKRLHIARRYLVFGSLRASVPWVFNDLFLANWGGEGRDISALLAQSGADLTLNLPNLTTANQILQTQFSSPPGEISPSFFDFLQWHRERNDE